MKIERAIALRNQLKTRVNDIYSCARIVGMESSAINQAYIDAKAQMPKGTPGWVFSFVDGYIAALNDDLYANWLEFGGFIDGEFYSTHRNSERYYEKHGFDAIEYSDNGRVLNRGHYWKTQVQYHGGIYTRETVKPYYFVD